MATFLLGIFVILPDVPIVWVPESSWSDFEYRYFFVNFDFKFEISDPENLINEYPHLYNHMKLFQYYGTQRGYRAISSTVSFLLILTSDSNSATPKTL